MPQDVENKYILLPRNSIRATTAQARNILTRIPSAKSTENPIGARLSGGLNANIQVLDTISEDGPKLIEVSEDTASRINSATYPLRAVPLVYYQFPRPYSSNGILNILSSSGSQKVTIKVVDANTGQGVPGMRVIAFTNFTNRYGGSGYTDSFGNLTLALSGNNIERLYVSPPAGYWGIYQEQITISRSMVFNAEPVDLSYSDCIRTLYGNTNFSAGTGVRVGVIDTGVGPHNDLNVVWGGNTVTGESPTDFFDWNGHGTHVAGLIGSNNAPPQGLRGMAPNVEIVALRVFGNNTTDGASNYAILKAMIFAQTKNCDIINLSLGGGPSNDIVKEAIQDAKESGMLVVIAAGNDDRQSVSYPAAHPGAVGVSAMGLDSTIPQGSFDESNILRPPNGVNQGEFVAGFSNIGPQIDAVGLGVGTLSTLPNNGFGPMSGTSMAAPMVSGAAACLLSRDSTVFNMPRDRTRSDTIEQLLLSNCVKRGFGLNYEGYGLPDPSVI